MADAIQDYGDPASARIAKTASTSTIQPKSRQGDTGTQVLSSWPPPVVDKLASAMRARARSDPHMGEGSVRGLYGQRPTGFESCHVPRLWTYLDGRQYRKHQSRRLQSISWSKPRIFIRQTQ